MPHQSLQLMYSQVVEFHLDEAGLDVEWTDIDVPDLAARGEWEGNTETLLGQYQDISPPDLQVHQLKYLNGSRQFCQALMATVLLSAYMGFIAILLAKRCLSPN